MADGVPIISMDAVASVNAAASNDLGFIKRLLLNWYVFVT